MNIRNLVLRALTVSAFACAVVAIFAALPASAFAQIDMAYIDKSKVPAKGNRLNDFVPAGWTIEERLRADLTEDSKADFVLKLIEDKPETNKDGEAVNLSRALVIVVQGKDGKFNLGAVADKLLQCTGCGGALYGGVVDAPANVKVENGVIIVEQDHGSRWVTDLTYRFRFEAATGKFLLIGFDYKNNDRVEGGVVTESTNYSTGARTTFRGNVKGKKDTTVKSTVPKTKTYIDQVDTEKFDEEATKRLGLD